MTAMVAVATCDAIEAAAGVRPGIKWTNDIILNGKKLVGILTEMSVEWESGTLQYLVTGIGINCNHKISDFPPEVQEMATSLALELGHPVDRCRLAAELTKGALWGQPGDRQREAGVAGAIPAGLHYHRSAGAGDPGRQPQNRACHRN